MAAINPFDDLTTNCWEVVNSIGAVRVDHLAEEGADMTQANHSCQLACQDEDAVQNDQGRVGRAERSGGREQRTAGAH